MEKGEGRKEALTSRSKWLHRVPDSRKGYSSDEGPCLALPRPIWRGSTGKYVKFFFNFL
jgi:hypothetical protein